MTPSSEAYVIEGALTEMEQLCATCNHHLIEGKTWLLTSRGVDPFGQVKGCQHCEVYFWYNPKGVHYNTTGNGKDKLSG